MEKDNLSDELQPIEQLHRSRNDSTKASANHFAAHRERVMILLAKASRVLDAGLSKDKDQNIAEKRIAILGAGNCNDLDLPSLTSLFDRIVLADIDTDACAAAVMRQTGERTNSPQFSVSYADVSGIVATLGEISGANGSSFEMNCGAVTDALAHGLQSSLPPANFHCVASLCLLSQLIDSLFVTFGRDSERLVELIQLQRRQHLHYLINSLAPGGIGLLVFDFLASTSLPNLMQIPDQQFLPTISAAIAARNFFTGLNPFLVHQQLLADPEFQSRVSSVQLHTPWRWNIGEKQFAVSAIVFQRIC